MNVRVYITGYIYERPALTFRKLRQLELAAGATKRHNPRGSRGPATPDTPAQWATEREAALQVEKRYRTEVADWKPHDHPRQSLDYIRRAHILKVATALDPAPEGCLRRCRLPVTEEAYA